MIRLSALLLALAVGGLLVAQQPKEPTYEGKPLSEWVKALKSHDPKLQQKGEAAIQALAGEPEKVGTALLASAAEPLTDPPNAPYLAPERRMLVEFGPRAVPTLAGGLWSANERMRWVSLLVIADIGADARSLGPSLVRLLSDPDESGRRQAARCLGRIDSQASIPALKKALEDRSTEVRLAAAESLVWLGADADVVLPVLIAELKDSGTASLIGRLGPQAAPAVPALIAALPEADQPKADLLAAAIADTLGRIGPSAAKAVPALKKKLAGDKKNAEFISLSVAEALWQIARDPDAAKILRERLAVAQRRNQHTERLVSVLWRIDRGPETVTALTEHLKSESPYLAIAAAGVLGTKAKDAVPLLARMLTHKDADVRAEAVIALVRLGPEGKEALEALRATTKDDSSSIAFWAALAVCRLEPKPEAVTAVAGYMVSDPFLRYDAAQVFGLLGPAAKPAIATLTLALADADERLRLAAAVALWRIEHHPLTLTAAAELLRSADPRVREQAAVELGAAFGADAKPAVPDLVKRLFDPFSAVRSASAEAIGRVGPAAKDAAPALLAVLDGDEPGYVQSAACEALGLIEPADKDAVATVLKRKLDHPDPAVRIHAALALFLVSGDKAGEKEAERGLGYRTHQVRITAAEALWRMKKDERVVSLLVRALEESNLDGTESDNERYMAARALGRIGSAAKPAVPELVKLLPHHDAMLAATAAGALKTIDPDAAKKAGVK